MRIILATLLLILFCTAVLQNVFWLAALIALWFTFRYGAVSLVVAAILIDAYFGAFHQVPYFSILALVWYFVSELISLRMRIME